jgi:hypothetical protein
LSPTASGSAAKAAGIDAASQQTVSPPASEKPDSAKLDSVTSRSQIPHLPEGFQLAASLTNAPSVSGNLSPASPPNPPEVATTPKLVTVSVLASEVRRPVDVVIKLIEKHGFGKLTANSLVNPEGVLPALGLKVARASSAVLKYAPSAAPDFPSSSQPKSSVSSSPAVKGLVKGS